MPRVLGCAVASLFAASLMAQLPEPGASAPALTAASWLNWTGDAPTLAGLQGRVVLLEFWGTWCGPCVRAMPAIQKLHTRYRDQGLTVLAITYEAAATIEPFLQQNGYTMPVGCDTEKAMVGAYGIKSWPSTVVIGKDGKVAHVGSPYDAEAAVEAALGLEAGPGALLDAWLATQATDEPKTRRAALQRLVDKAPRDFDVQTWARSHLPAETAATGDAPIAVPAGATKPAPPRDLLPQTIAAWHGKPADRDALLQRLANAEPATLDLATFAREQFGKAFPFDEAELAQLLAEKDYDGVVTALGLRGAQPAVLAAAAKSEALQSFCRGKEGDARRMAKKGLMAQTWVFPGALPKDEATNGKFFRDLSISGIATSPDRKQIVGILLAGEQLKKEDAEAFVTTRLRHALLMADLAAGRPPLLEGLDDRIGKEREAVLKDLVERYGAPELPERK